MPKRKIVHGLAQYYVPGRAMPKIAYRGDVVELTDEEAERLDRVGATIAADEPLPRIEGSVIDNLPENATEEELVGWVRDATDLEVATLLQVRPNLEDRVALALKQLKRRTSKQAEVKKKITAAKKVDPPAKMDAPVEEVNVDDVVGGTVPAVRAFLADHPELHDEVARAEARRASAAREQPRDGVRQAVETARRHVQP